jgi:ribosomal protein L7/L12
MFTIDWSGEEYPGQVKGTLTKLLKANNESTFKWSLKEFESSLDFSKLRKGDYITLLFCALDEEIMKKGYQLLFIEMYDDEYHYTILKREKIKSALHINGNDFEMHTSKRYKLYLIAMGNSQAKVMLYLKSKHNIGLKEIKSYVNNLPILMGQGYLTQLKKVEEELKALGCKYEIKE